MSRYLTLMTTPWLFSRVTLANFGHGRIYVLHAVKIKIAVIVTLKYAARPFSLIAIIMRYTPVALPIIP